MSSIRWDHANPVGGGDFLKLVSVVVNIVVGCVKKNQIDEKMKKMHGLDIMCTTEDKI